MLRWVLVVLGHCLLTGGVHSCRPRKAIPGARRSIQKHPNLSDRTKDDGTTHQGQNQIWTLRRERGGYTTSCQSMRLRLLRLR